MRVSACQEFSSSGSSRTRSQARTIPVLGTRRKNRRRKLRITPAKLRANSTARSRHTGITCGLVKVQKSAGRLHLVNQVAVLLARRADDVLQGPGQASGLLLADSKSGRGRGLLL